MFETIKRYWSNFVYLFKDLFSLNRPGIPRNFRAEVKIWERRINTSETRRFIMGAVYNFHWDAATSPAGISNYNLIVLQNGMPLINTDVYSTSYEQRLDEGTNVTAEVRAKSSSGDVGEAATLSFMVSYNPKPTTPGNFGADFVRWE